MNIFNSLLAQLVKYDVHTTRKINSIHAIFYHILSLYNTRVTKLVRQSQMRHHHHSSVSLTGSRHNIADVIFTRQNKLGRKE